MPLVRPRRITRRSQIYATDETSTAGAAAITFAVSAIDASRSVPPAGTGSVAFGSAFSASGIATQPITSTGAVTFVVSAIGGSGIAPIAAGRAA